MGKTAVQTILEFANSGQSAGLQTWIRHNAELLIEQERAQIVAAWIAGNKDGWDMQTDWPEDGERYYDETFNAPENI